MTPDTITGFAAAGAAGFGLGSALYRPGDSVSTVTEKAAAFIAAWRGLSADRNSPGIS